MNDRPEELRVLLVTSSYPRYDGDSASIFLRYFARHIASMGARVHVIAPADPTVRAGQLDDGVSVHYFRYFPNCRHMLAYGSGILTNLRRRPWIAVQVPFFVLALFYSLVRESLKFGPAVIHAHWVVPVGFVSVLVGKLLTLCMKRDVILSHV